MASIAGTGCIQGQVVLRIPLSDLTTPSTDLSLPIPGVKIELTPKGASSTAKASNVMTEIDGSFCFEGLPPGLHTVWYPKQIVWGGTTFPAVSTTMVVDVDAPDGSSCAIGGCGPAATFEYGIDATSQTARMTASAQAIEQSMGVTAASTLGIAQMLANASNAVAAHHPMIDDTAAAVIDMAGTLNTASTGIDSIAATLSNASTNVMNSTLLASTADAVQGIRTALRDMATFPYAGPADGNGQAPSARTSRTPVAAGSSIRGGVQAALDDLGLADTMTDADLARLFPSETDDDGEVTYKWAGPAVATRTSFRSNGTGHAGDVLISGGLARFQQQTQTALREVSEAFAIVKPFSDATTDDATIATQKAIVLDTLQQIVAEPGRPDGLRPIAIDAHFNSLLTDQITVGRNRFPLPLGTPIRRNGNLNALKYMLGIETAVIVDQTTESQVTEWQRAEDAVNVCLAAWKSFHGTEKLKLGEHLQELDGYFGALSEGVESARNMLLSVRFTVQEQAATQFPIPGGKVTTDDLLSMVDDLAQNIGPKYITDWKGRGIGTIEGRAATLKNTIAAVNALGAPGPPTVPGGPPTPGLFPFDNARVSSAFGDIVRLLQGTEDVCQEINAGI